MDGVALALLAASPGKVMTSAASKALHDPNPHLHLVNLPLPT